MSKIKDFDSLRLSFVDCPHCRNYHFCDDIIRSMSKAFKKYEQKEKVQKRGGKMRVAAGILTIIGGLCSLAIGGEIFVLTAEMVGFEAAVETTGWTVWLVFLLLGLTIGGSICAFRRKYWGLALTGAICSVFIGFATFVFGVIGYVFSTMGILAVVFLTKRKYEFE